MGLRTLFSYYMVSTHFKGEFGFGKIFGEGLDWAKYFGLVWAGQNIQTGFWLGKKFRLGLAKYRGRLELCKLFRLCFGWAIYSELVWVGQIIQDGFGLGKLSRVSLG